jgi:cell wall-associated NlpC family hydrolase
VAAALRSVDAAVDDPLASGDGSAIAFSSPGTGSTSSDLARPFAAFSASARTLGDSLVALARAQIGRRYRFGGTTPEHGFDCSGLVRYVLAIMHVPLPRTAKDQARTGAFVERDTSQLRPGDLVTFGSTRRISHIGIYVGGGRFVQASSKAGRVIETPLNRRLVPGVKPWRGARRVVQPDALPELAPSSVTTRDDDG